MNNGIENDLNGEFDRIEWMIKFRAEIKIMNFEF